LVTVKNAAQRYELLCRNAVLQATTLAMNERLGKLNQSLSEQVAKVAEQNQQLEQLNEALSENLRRSVELCLQTMQTFYPRLGSQARRVFGICQAMADLLKLSAADRQVLEFSALLHDIGLVGVPRQLIKRWQIEPETLDEPQRALVQQHPILGQELVGFIHHLRAVGPVIRSHHERFDGRGYPDRLQGEGIPWIGRLLAVAVHYAESRYEDLVTLETIKINSGAAFDPDAVRVFLRSLPRAVVPHKEREVLLSELRPGMVMAKGIYTANGMLLIPEGQVLSELYIDKLNNHNRVSAIVQALLVFC
jgi:response regulator RpfG family c-di-GMP phosphodiesterase